MKIAFDLDGVLVPDYNRIPDLSEAEFFEQTLYAKPLFNPKGDFDVVTARLEYNRPVTQRWLSQLTAQPTNLFMRDDVDESPAEFKYRVCKREGYTVYVESDPEIAKDMASFALIDRSMRLTVLHFDEFVNRNLSDVVRYDHT